MSMYVFVASTLHPTPITRARMSPGPSRGSMRDREPNSMSLRSGVGSCSCLPSTPSCVLRSRTGRVLRQGPAPLQLLVVTTYPSAPRGIRRIAPCPNLEISPPPGRMLVIVFRGGRCTYGPSSQCWRSQLLEDALQQRQVAA